MKKIYLILMLAVSSYGYSVPLMGYGAQTCSSYLDAAEDRYGERMISFGSYAHGALTAYNIMSESELIVGRSDVKIFAPDATTLRRVLIKYCEDNLTLRFNTAVMAIWSEYGK